MASEPMRRAACCVLSFDSVGLDWPSKTRTSRAGPPRRPRRGECAGALNVRWNAARRVADAHGALHVAVGEVGGHGAALPRPRAARARGNAPPRPRVSVDRVGAPSQSRRDRLSRCGRRGSQPSADQPGYAARRGAGLRRRQHPGWRNDILSRHGRFGRGRTYRAFGSCSRRAGLEGIGDTCPRARRRLHPRDASFRPGGRLPHQEGTFRSHEVVVPGRSRRSSSNRSHHRAVGAALLAADTSDKIGSVAICRCLSCGPDNVTRRLPLSPSDGHPSNGDKP
jgi:hypothetical protein